MDNLNGLFAFVRTAETLSFVAAGRSLGVSASAVGKTIARLEQRLDIRLFQRSTRRISLTEEGQLFYERCRRIVDDLDDAESMLSRTKEAPRGRLRVSLPTIGYRFLLPHLPEFEQLYPEIELDLDFNDQMVNVIEEGFDAVIRSGDLPDSSLMARRLGPFRQVLAASSEYLDRRGIPKALTDLQHHACLRYRFPTSGKLQDWVIGGAANGVGLHLPPALVCNNMEALYGATVRGLGIAYMPDFLVADAVKAGELRTLLDDCLIQTGQFWVLWPSNRHLSPKLRVFVDFIAPRLFSGTRL
ncbi:LysR family transcriptional regulator [Phyllobacterium myrsinacearum]|uniref:DNA-binding transcriptional LysR family regulator n=1 Tax=Phyllobacterium myrsinacearum TaxID=28101 RepID=A0A839EDX8_9HYPH|nr:LysR family transcriptional regulator [Phyllobacterium myrsinacearum]MBA8878141.1 DNA-binding transcriptional LysR family regulator [Phyllobacterium myrsinacearum]